MNNTDWQRKLVEAITIEDKQAVWEAWKAQRETIIEANTPAAPTAPAKPKRTRKATKP